MNQDELLVVIDQIYEAATDTGRWPVVLQTIADAFGAEDASLSAVSPQAVPWLVAPRTDPAFLQSYGEHYHPLNLFWEQMTRVPVGTAVTDRMVLAPETLRSSQFFNEWSRPQKYLSVIGATLLAEDDWRVEFVIPGKAEFGPEHLKLYNVLAPHLRRAVQLNHRLQCAAMDQSYSYTALDNVEQGILIVDQKARILFTNRAAGKSFSEGLRVVDGRLSGDLQAETARLHGAIASPLDSADDIRDRVTISRGPHRAPLSLLVVPMRSEPDRIARSQQGAIILITDPDTAIVPYAGQLQKQFGLTRTEAALVHEMLQGGSIQAVAERMSITLATARTHLHRIFGKTGAKRQADLIRLVLSPRPDTRVPDKRRNGGNARD